MRRDTAPWSEARTEWLSRDLAANVGVSVSRLRFLLAVFGRATGATFEWSASGATVRVWGLGERRIALSPAAAESVTRRT